MSDHTTDAPVRKDLLTLLAITILVCVCPKIGMAQVDVLGSEITWSDSLTTPSTSLDSYVSRKLALLSSNDLDERAKGSDRIRNGVIIGAVAGLIVGYLGIKWHEYGTETNCSIGCAVRHLGGGVAIGAITGGIIAGLTQPNKPASRFKQR